MSGVIHMARQTGLWLCALALFMAYLLLCAVGAVVVVISVAIRVFSFQAVLGVFTVVMVVIYG